MCPCRSFALPLTGQSARLGGDVTRYVFIVEDLHLLLLAGLPAHYHPPEPLTHLSFGATRRAVSRDGHPDLETAMTLAIIRLELSAADLRQAAARTQDAR